MSWPVMAVLAAAVAATPAVPARFQGGSLPAPPGPAVGGGEVLLEVAVDGRGGVSAVRTLRDTPPYTEALRIAVGGWTFEPARNSSGAAVPSSVLVAGSFRPPTSTGPSAGEPARDVASPAAGLPFATSTAPALYPPQAQGDGQVLVEIAVATDGSAAPRVVRGAAGFDEASMQAARQWRFRPAAGRAYVVFGFRQPVTTAPVR